MVEHPIGDFIEPGNYMLPQLHIDFGLTNNGLDNFYDFIEDQVEKASPEEKVARNHLGKESSCYGMLPFSRAQEKLETWKDNGATDLAMFRLEKTNLQAALRARRNDAELLAQRDEVDTIIQALMDERKSLEADKKTKKEIYPKQGEQKMNYI